MGDPDTTQNEWALLLLGRGPRPGRLRTLEAGRCALGPARRPQGQGSRGTAVRERGTGRGGEQLSCHSLRPQGRRRCGAKAPRAPLFPRGTEGALGPDSSRQDARRPSGLGVSALRAAPVSATCPPTGPRTRPAPPRGLGTESCFRKAGQGGRPRESDSPEGRRPPCRWDRAGGAGSGRCPSASAGEVAQQWPQPKPPCPRRRSPSSQRVLGPSGVGPWSPRAAHTAGGASQQPPHRSAGEEGKGAVFFLTDQGCSC